MNNNKNRCEDLVLKILKLLDESYPMKRQLTIEDLTGAAGKIMADLPKVESDFIISVIDSMHCRGLINKGNFASGLGNATSFYRDSIITPQGKEYLYREIKKTIVPN